MPRRNTRQSRDNNGAVVLVKTPRTLEERDRAAWDGRNARTPDEEWALELMRHTIGSGRELAVSSLETMVEQGGLAPHTTTQPFWRSRGILDTDIAIKGFQQITEDFQACHMADVEVADTRVANRSEDEWPTLARLFAEDGPPDGS